MSSRPSVLLLVLGAGVAVLVGIAGMALLPPAPPDRLPWPEAEELRELNAYLTPVERAPRGASTEGVVVSEDPFGVVFAPEPGAEPARRDRVWRLTAIVISGDSRLAVVNGQLVRPGQTVDGGRITAIDPDRVVIEEPDGSESTLRLQPGEAE